MKEDALKMIPIVNAHAIGNATRTRTEVQMNCPDCGTKMWQTGWPINGDGEERHCCPKCRCSIVITHGNIVEAQSASDEGLGFYSAYKEEEQIGSPKEETETQV